MKYYKPTVDVYDAKTLAKIQANATSCGIGTCSNGLCKTGICGTTTYK